MTGMTGLPPFFVNFQRMGTLNVFSPEPPQNIQNTPKPVIPVIAPDSLKIDGS
jgi:hypothetical protein